VGQWSGKIFGRRPGDAKTRGAEGSRNRCSIIRNGEEFRWKRDVKEGNDKIIRLENLVNRGKRDCIRGFGTEGHYVLFRPCHVRGTSAHRK